MAKIIIHTLDLDGHVGPAIPMVRKLIECNHQVIWITGRKYENRIKATRASFRPRVKGIDPGNIDLYDLYPRFKELKGFAQVRYWLKDFHLAKIEADIEDLKSILRDFPADILIGDTISFSTFFLSEMTGIPCACISLLPLPVPDKHIAPYGLGLTPGNTPITKLRNQSLNYLVDHILLRDLTQYANDIRKRLGLLPLKGSFLPAMCRIPTLIMQISTPAFEYPRRDQPSNLHFVGPMLPKPNPAFTPPAWWSDLNGTQPVVLVTQGTVSMNWKDLVIPTIEVLEHEDVLVIAVPFDTQAFGAIPQNVRAEKFIPFEHLLPRVDVMVTNAGYGGVQQALANGVPLVVAGATEEKMEVAARVAWSKSGINLRKKDPSPDDIRQAVLEVLSNPMYRQNAKRIQADFAKHDAPMEAVRLLEALAGKRLAPKSNLHQKTSISSLAAVKSSQFE
ncbi:MAG TPA: nucleotide disphospho-sugar-binding domain-containing protein [Anaerolineales bacterium]|nr:nucleotide disphospho-sugar-binding domain-containing protein [Anaerolineales bacterium]